MSEALRARPDPRVVSWLESLTGGVGISAITLAELVAVVRRLPDGRRRSVLSSAIDAAVAPYREAGAVLPFDDVAADRYADVLVARERAGLPITMADAQIVAICLARGASCATRNVRDFDHTGVTLIDPWR